MRCVMANRKIKMRSVAEDLFIAVNVENKK